MPQLITSPWFMVLTMLWLLFATLSPRKILHYVLPHTPLTKMPKNHNQTPNWTWPWL